MATRLKPAKQVMAMWAMLMLLQPNSLVFQLDSWVLNSETSVDSHHEWRFDIKYFKTLFKNNQTDDKIPKITKKQMPGKLPDKKWIPRSQKTKKI